LLSGQTFGARTFINDERHKITTTAITDTYLLIMPRRKFEKLSVEHPETAKKVLENLDLVLT